MNACKQSRSAYTLIELLVVIALIAVLAALTVAFFPSAASSARESRAAMQLQGWLTVAKQRALRDQAPRGLRLWFINGINSGSALSTLPAWNNTQTYNPPFDGVTYNGLAYRCLVANTNVPPTNAAFWSPWLVAIECQYLESPDDYSVGRVSSFNSTQPNDGIVFDFAGTPGDLLNGHTLANAEMPFWSVQPGDYLEVFGTGLMHQIVAVLGQNSVRIYPPLPYAINATTPNYRIVRSPRPVGDETLKMPAETVIDLQTNFIYGNVLPINAAGQVDIVFSPSGAVISRGVASANFHLWVRAPDATIPNDPFRGDPTIVSVFVRTGYTGAFPIDRGGNPYLRVY